MGYLTKYGAFWGMLPQTTGKMIFVAPAASYTVDGNTYVASDDNDGLSPERAMLTIDAGHNKLTASVGDVLVLLPGSHTVTAAVTLDTAGVTIVGIPSNRPAANDRSGGSGVRNRTQITTTASAGAIFQFTAAGDDVEIAYLHFNLITAGEGIDIVLGADRPFIHDCTFANVGAGSTSSECIHFSSSTTGSVTGATIRNCYFLVTGNQGPAIRALGTVYGLTIENSTFELQGSTAWDDAIEILDPGTLGTIIRDCDFFEPTSVTTVITNCIDTTGCTVDGNTHIYRCYFPGDAKVGINSSATVDILVSDCWVAGTTAGRNNVNAAA